MRWLRRGVNEFQATKRHLTELGANPVCPAGRRLDALGDASN